MCEDCHRIEAKDFWKAVVQVRQKVEANYFSFVDGKTVTQRNLWMIFSGEDVLTLARYHSNKYSAWCFFSYWS